MPHTLTRTIGPSHHRLTERAAFLQGDALQHEVLADIDEARSLGITAVPTFVFEGQWAVQGGQETSTFLRVLEQVAKESHPSSSPTEGTCTDGTCETPRES